MFAQEIEASADMGEDHLSKVFATKLSLPKFVSLINRLTPRQRDLVCSIGLESILHICCESLPRRLIIYIVSRFNPKSRVLTLSNGSSYTLSPSSIHKTLGTPIGGKKIGEKVDPKVRYSIAELTKCQGHYPTINELDSLITPQLEGDPFKVVFTMFAMTAFFCPSSHDAVSPMYLHIVRNPEEIGQFDFSSAILEKLVSCIQAFKEGNTCVLGGNLLSLMAIYFEFLDVDLIPAPSKSVSPRISVWSTSLVLELEMMDCVCKETFQYGKLPNKSFSSTPFGFMQARAQPSVGKSYEDLLHLVLSVSPDKNHKVVKEQLPSIVSGLNYQLMDMIQPIVIENIMNVVALIAASNPIATPNNMTDTKKHISSVNQSSVLRCHDNETDCAHNLFCPGTLKEISPVCPTDDGLSNSVCPISVKEISAVCPADDVNTTSPTGCIVIAQSTAARDDNRESVNMEEDNSEQLMLLPVPSIDLLDKIGDEAMKDSFLNMHCLRDVLKYIPIQTLPGLPQFPELLKSLEPKKIDYEYLNDSTVSNIDIMALVLEQSAVERESRGSKDQYEHLAEEKVNFFEELDPGSSFTNALGSKLSKVTLNCNKRTSSSPRAGTSMPCIALKKRARMLQMTEDNPSVSADDLSIQEGAAGCSMQKPYTGIANSDSDSMKTPDRFPTDEVIMDDSEFDRQFLMSTLRVEEEHFAAKGCSQLLTPGPINITNSRPASLVEAHRYRNSNNSEIFIQDQVNPNTSGSSNGVSAQCYENTTSTQFMNENTRFPNYCGPSTEHQTQPYAYPNRSQQNNAQNSRFNLSEISPNVVVSDFTASLVEIEVFEDIIARVPKTLRSKTINVVRLGSKWAEHRVFSLSMNVYGKVNPYVIDVMGKCVMVEDAEKEKLGLLPKGFWLRFYVDCKIAGMFIKSCETPWTLSKLLTHQVTGVKLDTRDLVHLPLYTEGFFFLLVVNFRENAFQVLYPNTQIDFVSGPANLAIENFRSAFKLAYKHSHRKVDNMDISFRSVCPSDKKADSGVYVMEMIRRQTGGIMLSFQPNHAKVLRQSLTYYMLAHPFNEKMPPETKDILKKHGIPYDYTTSGYSPFMDQHDESNSDGAKDPFEAMMEF